MNERPRAVSVKVTTHLTASGQYAVGIITQEWQGAVRVDRRLARLRPVPLPGARPFGVDPDVWRALAALEDLVQEQRTDGG
jgi:hypothetical protein